MLFLATGPARGVDRSAFPINQAVVNGSASLWFIVPAASDDDEQGQKESVFHESTFPFRRFLQR